MMQEQEIKAILSKIKWDTTLSTDDLYRILPGRKVISGALIKNGYSCAS